MAANLRWLYIGRGLRSFSTAFLTVIFPLYLAVSGYSAARIGFLLALSGGVTVLLVVAVGVLGDRLGRRIMLMGLALFGVVGGLTMGLTSQFWLAVLASGLGGVGKGGGAGSGGSWGAIFPAEQPLVAASVTNDNRTRAFGTLSFVGVMAGAAGSLVAIIPRLLHNAGWTFAGGYRLLFLASMALSFLMFLAAIPLREERSIPETRLEDGNSTTPISFRGLLGRLGVTNALNGLGFGFLGPLLTYWFYRRFGVGAAELGILYTVINLASAFPYLWSANLAARLGVVRTVTVTRAMGLVVLLGMALAPSYWIAGGLYMLRMVFNSLGMPARQSFTMGVSDDRYRSRLSAFSQVPSGITSMISPAVGGALMDTILDIPIFGATLFMSLNLVFYYWFFRDIRPPEEERHKPEAATARSPSA
ncbi:MAG: MFS transporter [Clostridia bacterium]